MSFKTFDLAHDVASLVSSINEVVNVSSSLYTTSSGDLNVKFYNNIATGSGQPALGGYWQTVYDSSPTSPQATPLFDVSFGLLSGTSGSYYSPGALYGCADEKVKVYRQMASALLGDPGYSFPWNECFFIMVKRGLMKDELKKGSVSLILNSYDRTAFVTASDAGAATNFKQTVGGDWSPLYSGSSTTVVGQVYYNAGVIVLPASASGLPWTGSFATTPWSGSGGSSNLPYLMQSQSIDDCVDGLRCHVDKVAFHNQTNLYSTVYFCRATNTEFNYSSNPTYVDDNKRIRVTSGSNVLQSRTYITTVGLYDANDNLLAVGKVNKPITKSPDTEAIFRIRLDY